MGPEAIWLEVLNGGREGTYRFTCPTCMDAVEKRADRKIVALLVSAGVDVADATAAAAVTQTELDFGGEGRVTQVAPSRSQVDAPAFTIDDVIRFHFLLRDDEFLKELIDGS